MRSLQSIRLTFCRYLVPPLCLHASVLGSLPSCKSAQVRRWCLELSRHPVPLVRCRLEQVLRLEPSMYVYGKLLTSHGVGRISNYARSADFRNQVVQKMLMMKKCLTFPIRFCTIYQYLQDRLAVRQLPSDCLHKSVTHFKHPGQRSFLCRYERDYHGGLHDDDALQPGSVTIILSDGTPCGLSFDGMPLSVCFKVMVLFAWLTRYYDWY